MSKPTKQPKQPSPRSFPAGKFLLITGALSNITLWVGAFVSTEAQGPVATWVRDWFLPVAGGISGLAMGITIAAGLVFTLDKLSQMPAYFEKKVRGKDEYTRTINTRYWGAVAAVVLLLIISPCLLAPHVLMTMTKAADLTAVIGTGGWAVTWAVGRIVAADLALGAIALVNGAPLTSMSVQSAQQPVQHAGAVQVHAPSTAVHSAPPASALHQKCTALVEQYTCTAPGCTWKPDLSKLLKSKDPEKSASASKGGHVHAQHAPVPLDQSLLLTSDDKAKKAGDQ